MSIKAVFQIGAVALVTITITGVSVAAERPRYDFRTSEAYASLPKDVAQRLEQVHHDFMLLRGALEQYADDHGDQAPKDLEALVPSYLRELPKDPFATQATSVDQTREPCISSLDGWGYRFRQGLGRAWVISSAGLPDFPYLARRGNVGLYQAKGLWLSGQQVFELERPQSK